MNRPKYKELYEIERRKVNRFKGDLYSFLEDLKNIGLNIKYYTEKPENELAQYFRIDLDLGDKQLMFRFNDEYGVFKMSFAEIVWRKEIKKYLENSSKFFKDFCEDTGAKIIEVKRPSINIGEDK